MIAAEAVYQSTAFPPEWANRYVGVPFVAKGCTPDGWDCWGLMRYVYAAHLGIALPDFSGDYEDPHDSRRVAALFDFGIAEHHWLEISETDARPGDGVLLRVVGHVCHVGVIVNGNRMLHVLPGCETSITRTRAKVWQPVGFYRWNGPPKSSSLSS